MSIAELIALTMEWSKPEPWRKVAIASLEHKRLFIHFRAAVEDHPYFGRPSVSAEQLLQQDGIDELNEESRVARDKVLSLFNPGPPTIADGLRQHAPQLLGMLPAIEPLDVGTADTGPLFAAMLAIEGELRAMAAKPAATDAPAPATRRDIDWWCEKLAEYESEWADDSGLTPTAFARKNGLNEDTTRKMFNKAREELDRRKETLRTKRKQRG